MDGDPDVESAVDGFSLVLPLPYRVAIILVTGVWAWAVNLQFLDLSRIDVPALIRHPSRPSLQHPAHHVSTYRLAIIITIPLITSLLLFWLVTRGSVTAVLSWQILPQSYLVFLAICFLLPIKRLSGTGRYRFLATLKRVSVGGLAENHGGKFGDILLADALTSYAKVLGDLFVSSCMLFTPGLVSTATPNRGCGGAYMVPLVISIPSLIRLRQCLIEFLRVRKNRTLATGWGGTHLANALKYSSAFPVIILSAMQRSYDPKVTGLGEATLFRLWLFFVFVNSFYSFYWDVAKDWDLSLFASPSERNDPEHPYGLRRHRYFRIPNLYYSAIGIDLLLRCTWSFKLSPHLDHFNDLEGGIFLMELLEVLRRWMWIFFRIETEWVRNNRGPAPDDVLLGEFSGKLDED